MLLYAVMKFVLHKNALAWIMFISMCFVYDLIKCQFLKGMVHNS